MKADLTYNIPEQTLKGRIGAVFVDCLAGSGGRAGTKSKEGPNWLLANNAFATGVHFGGHLFGPLPQGSYWMVPDAKPNRVRLNPFPENFMHGRTGFLIHGRGEIGSHGCIVPYAFANVTKICEAVSMLHKSGFKPVLQVIAVSSNLGNIFQA